MDLSLATSLRISEVLAIRSDGLDLDADVPTLRVSGKIEYLRGVGYVEGTTKTSATRRTIPLPQFAVAILRERIGRYGEGLVFRSSNSAGGPISQNNVRRTLRAAIEDSEFASWFSPHTARKTNLSAVYAAHGAEVAAEVAGHTDGGKLIRSTYGDRSRHTVANVTDITERFGRTGP